MDTAEPKKTEFNRLASGATVSLLFILIICAGVIVAYYYFEGRKHIYKLDYMDWETKQQEALKLNDFWLTLAGRQKPRDQADTLLASDLRLAFVQPAEDAQVQASAMRRLIRESSYEQLSIPVEAVTGWLWSLETLSSQDFLRKLEKVRQNKVEDILTTLPPPPNPKDAKYQYDIRAELGKCLTFWWIAGIWTGVTLLAALLCGLFHSNGWWQRDPKYAPYKFWVIALLLPAVAIWAASIVLWGLVSLPVIALSSAWSSGAALIYSKRLSTHPHREHIYTIDWTIVELEREIARTKQAGGRTEALEEQLERAKALRRRFLHLPQKGTLLEAATKAVDGAEATLDALEGLDK